MQMTKKLLALVLAALLAFGTFAMTASADSSAAGNVIASGKKSMSAIRSALTRDPIATSC